MLHLLFEKLGKPLLFRVGEIYIRLSAHLSQYLPMEKNVYVIHHDNKMKNVTLQYFFILALHSKVFAEKRNYMVEYRHTTKKKVVDNENIIGVVNKVRYTGSGDLKIKIPIINFIVAINDITLGYEEKKNILSHDKDDNLNLVYRLYHSENIDKLCVELKGNKKTWTGEECKRLRVGDIIHIQP